MPQFSQSAGKARLYGALRDQRSIDQAAEKEALSRKRRLNCAPIFISLLAPWLVFLLSFSVSAFYIHYLAPMCTSAVVLVLIAICFALIQSAQRALRLKRGDEFYRTYVAAAVTCAVIFGFVYGDLTFWDYMQPAYEIQHMATYDNVDPSQARGLFGGTSPTRGKRFQDAGTIYFDQKTFLDVNKSMSFKMGSLYCIAPISNSACQKNCGHDFWAVGVDCCSEDGGSFTCGEAGNRNAKSGLRSMSEGIRPYFRLAVLQAQGSQKITSTHPIFVEWVQDPLAKLHRWQELGYRRFVLAMTIGFVANAGTFLMLLWCSMSSMMREASESK